MPVTETELQEILKQPSVTLVDGLPKRWCHGTPNQGCGHFIATREDTWDTDNCDTKFNKPTCMSWRQPTLTKDQVLEKLLHIPHCKNCLANNNSYLFQAWYDISKTKIEKLAGLYARNWPEHLQQPYFFPFDDNKIIIRIITHDIDNEGDGELNLDNLLADFFVCTFWPEQEDLTNWSAEDMIEEYKFDLSEDFGWQQLLTTFPQPPRIEL